MSIDATARWNELHAVQNFSPRYPSEQVIRWTFHNFLREKAGEVNLLDAGAGAGRHAIFWAREGYSSTATDVSSLAVSQIKEWAQRENVVVDAQTAEADALPFADDSFDGVLSFGVIYYLTYARMKKAASEMWRVLKPGGKAFVMIKSNRDSRALSGEPLDRWSVKVTEPEPGGGWAAETGMTLAFLDRDSVEECFNQYAEKSIDISSVTSCNGRFVNDDWLIQLRK